MDCAEFRRALHGPDLTEATTGYRAAWAKHLLACPDCRAYNDELFQRLTAERPDLVLRAMGKVVPSIIKDHADPEYVDTVKGAKR